MKFKDIEEAVLAALNITSKLKDPELTTAMQSILDKCVAYREEQNLEAPGVINKDDPVIDYDPKTGEPFVTTAGEAGLDDESMSALRKKFSTEEEPIGTIPKGDNRPLWVGKDGQVHIGEPGEEYTKQYGELDPHIRKALDDFASSNGHFGEQQAEGLDNLLEGLRDTPHDNRW